MAEAKVTRDVTTGIGTLSFPRVFKETAGKKDDGVTPTYDIQILIPKSERDDLRRILKAIKEVGEAKWGERWKQVRQPLRDGDKEKDQLAEDGQTKGEKYPERLGCYFMNARSTKPVAVVGRDRAPIVDPEQLYGGCKGKIAVSFYPYTNSGNSGIGVSLNGVQKIADGDSFGGGKPAVESMFDILEDDDLGLEDEPESEPEPTPAPAKKAAAAKKAPAKKAAAKPEPEPEPEDLDDLTSEEGGEDSDLDDLYGDLDDSDA